MDNLRLILIVVASLAIIALLIHGFWINKKERSTIFSHKNSAKPTQHEKSNLDWQADYDVLADSDTTTSDQKSLKASDDLNINPEPDLHIEPEPIQCDLFAVTEAPIENETEDAIQADRIKLDEHDKQPSESKTQTAPAPEKEVIILHVTGLYDNPLQGDVLLNSILQTGFQYGEMQIFHRHVDPAGNGAILFSLANMVKPGTLNPETMPEMTTPGISLFMMIPAFGDNLQNFKMMLQSAQRIAADVDGKVLDENHHMLTPEKIAEYKTRIKQTVELHSQQG